MTKDILILEGLKASLQRILQASGYLTNAGESVHLGRVDESQFSSDLPNGILVIEPGEAVPIQQAELEGEVLWEMPVQILGVITADLDDPLRPGLWLRSDIERAVFGQADRTLGGLLLPPPTDELGTGGLRYGPGKRFMEREPGSKTVGCEVDLLLRWTDTLGDPETG